MISEGHLWICCISKIAVFVVSDGGGDFQFFQQRNVQLCVDRLDMARALLVDRWVYAGTCDNLFRKRCIGSECQFFRAVFCTDSNSGGSSGTKPVSQLATCSGIHCPRFTFAKSKIANGECAVKKRLAGCCLIAEGIDDASSHAGSNKRPIRISSDKIRIYSILIICNAGVVIPAGIIAFQSRGESLLDVDVLLSSGAIRPIAPSEFDR